MYRSGFLRLGLPGLMALLVMASLALNAAADSGTVTVSATNSATLQITLSTTTADFGTNLDPAGTDSNSSATVVDFQGTTGDQGSYYLWKSSGSGMTLTVKSNKAWNGAISATENGGSASSLTVAGGALRYGSTAPTSYNEAAALTAITTSDANFVTGHAKGVSTTTFYYALRDDWTDDPGTFSSTVTLTVTAP